MFFRGFFRRRSFCCRHSCRCLCRCRYRSRGGCGLPEYLDIDEFVARFDERLGGLLLPETEYFPSRFADAARQAGVVAVARHDAESVDRLFVQDVHRVDYQRRIRRVLACRVGVLLDRGDRILEQHAFPCRELRVGEIAVDTLDRRRAVVGDFVEYVLDFPVRDVVGVDQHREFFIG